MYGNSNTKIPRIKLSEFCKKNYIRVLSIIDSSSQWNDISADHVNMLVEFEPNCIPGLIKLGKMKIELSVLLGCSVDIWTSPDISHFFRQEVISLAEPLYA
jgi:predicted nucleotidyltransferase